MKYCPSCQIKYADESLQFCLQDGTGLLEYADNAPAPTVDWSEKETVVRQAPITAGWEQKIRTTQEDAAVQPEAKKSNTLLTVALTALVMFVIFGGIGLGWAMFGGKDSENKNSSNVSVSNVKTTPSQTPPPANKTDSTPDALAGWLPTDYNASLNGERLTYYRGTTAEACRADCEANAKCAGFGLVRAGYYNPSDPPMCYLLSKVTSSSPSTCCISAIKK